MKKNLHISLRILLLFTLLFSAGSATSQTTVFSDDFAASAGATYTTTPGLIGTSTTWRQARSGTDFGAMINSGRLILSNDAGGAANIAGYALGYTAASSFTAPYNTVLANNAGVVTWSFNMRQTAPNPQGFGATDFGVAFILAGTTGTTNVLGTGYAVVLGTPNTKTDPVRLVRYNAGIRSHTNLINSNTTGLTDFGTQYISVKVTYTPSTNTWQLFVRNDGTVAADPSLGTLTSQGTTANSTYTAAALPLMGGYWNAQSTTNMTAFFDSVKVTVAVPAITSLNPSTKVAGTGAFTLTVNGNNFINGSTVRWNGVARTTTFVSATQLSASIPATDVVTSGTALVTVANGATVSNSASFIVEPAGTPTLTLSATSLNFATTVAGTPSTAQTYTISGANLTADPVVTAPANFEVSKDGSNYSSTLTLARTGNVLTAQPVTIYARTKNTTEGVYSGNITNAVTGGTTKSIAVTGTVLAAQPTVQTGAITFSGITSTSFNINLTAGNGAKRLIVLRSGGAVNALPVDGTTYEAATIFGTGSEIGTGNFAVFAGTGNTVNVTGLLAATAYHVSVVEFNGSATTENYLTTSPATGSTTTLNSPFGWQIFTPNTINKITFDTTVDGVNQDVFQAEGLAPLAEAGQLNSRAWAITGFSDGNIAFGGTSADETDYNRGVSGGGVEIGGIYAFHTSENNVAMGIQPATGDFAPGTITLRVQNQLVAAVTSLNIGYKIFINNDEAASTSVNFSYSSDNVTFTNVTGLNVISPAAADAQPSWKGSYRVVTLTGLNIPANNYVYIRWTGAPVSGTTLFDEFAIDDIMLVANPTTAFAEFDGVAENFSVQGNTKASADLTVVENLSLLGGKLDINGKTLTINGSVTNTALESLKGSAASSIVVTGNANKTLSFDLTTPGTTNLLNNLAINTTSSNTVTIANAVDINGNLTIDVGQTLNLGINALGGTLSPIFNNGTIRTQSTGSNPLPAGKSWGGTGKVIYDAASAQQTVVAGTYNGLTVSTTGGAILGGNIIVNGLLNLPANNPSATAGSLSTGTYSVTMGPLATNTGIGEVTGITTRNNIVANTLYTFGHQHTSIIFPAIGTLPTSMSLKLMIGNAPTWKPLAVKREYDFIQTGATNTKAVIKARYLDSEVNGNDESKLVDWARIGTGTPIDQGRSNFSTTENWVELTNANVGLYFTSSFDAVRLTLAESSVVSSTWVGAISDSWTTAANWSGNAVPIDGATVLIPDAATTAFDPTLNPSVSIKSLTIATGGILNAPNDPILNNPGAAAAVLTINGGAGAWVNNGVFNPGIGGSTVVFTNVDATMAGNTSFNNITVNSGATLRPLTNNVMRVAGVFTNNGTLATGAIENTVEYTGTNQVLAVPNLVTVAAYHNLIISGTGAVFPNALNIRGNLTTNQPVDFSGKTINLTGNDLQLIGGPAAPTFNNLVVNNSSGEVDLSSNVTVSGTLSLTNGNLSLGNNNLTLSNPVAGTFDTTHMIVTSGTGEVRKTFSSVGSYLFPIGEKISNATYSPITVSVTSGTFSNAYVGVSVSDGVHPNNYSGQDLLTRYWKVNQSGITGAVATIAATYLAADVVGTEASTSAAQLVGTFNQQTNPWVRYATLSNNTLTAAGAPLASGQTSVFTGIKGGTFTTVITGYGAFCQGQPITLTAEQTGGVAPLTYLWSNALGSNETATPSSATVGSATYSVTVKDANGITATGSAVVEILAPTNAGTISANQNICAGSTPDAITLSGYIGEILYWQRSASASFTTSVNIAHTGATLPGSIAGIVNATRYFRAVVQNGSCSTVFSSPVTVTVHSTIWDGATWSNGLPTSATTVSITGNFTATADITACNITVSNNAVVIIPSGFDITLTGALTVSSGSFTLENNANLIQTGATNTNSGNIIVKRDSSPLYRLDYTMWSSPTTSTQPTTAQQTLNQFSPQTSLNRFYSYETATNTFSAISAATQFVSGKGYLIRVRNNHPAYNPAAPVPGTIWTGSFTGVPQNGPVAVALAYTAPAVGQPNSNFNMVGNPYPSVISAAQFVSNNAATIDGTLHFWRRRNDAEGTGTYNTFYASWTNAGSITTMPGVPAPNGEIAVGQGFLVNATASGNLMFQNSQRATNPLTSVFFRNQQITENNRIWLNLTNTEGTFSQTLVGYTTDATNDVDFGLDGKYINDGAIALTSRLAESEYVIQARQLPFDASDVVPLNFKTPISGSFTIAIDHLDGLFITGQNIYLKDNLMNITHDLKASAYTFATEAGNFSDRFEIVYQNYLSTDQPLESATVIFYKEGTDVVVNSGTNIMKSVLIYDIRGRLVTKLEDVNASEAKVKVGAAAQVLIVKVIFDDDTIITKKMVN